VNNLSLHFQLSTSIVPPEVLAPTINVTDQNINEELCTVDGMMIDAPEDALEDTELQPLRSPLTFDSAEGDRIADSTHTPTITEYDLQLPFTLANTTTHAQASGLLFSDDAPVPTYSKKKMAERQVKKGHQLLSKWPNFSDNFSEEFRQRARDLIINDKCAPQGIRRLVEVNFNICQETIGGLLPLSTFVTARRRQELEEYGFTVIDNVFSKEEVDLCKSCLDAVINVNCIDNRSYLYLSRGGRMPGIVTKHGWSKFRTLHLFRKCCRATPTFGQ